MNIYGFEYAVPDNAMEYDWGGTGMGVWRWGRAGRGYVMDENRASTWSHVWARR